MQLLAALTSFATDNGEGLVGETDDKIITFASLGVIVFFVMVVVALASLQHFLELRRRVGW